MWPRIAVGVGVLLVGVGVAAVFVVRALSGASLTTDATALAKVDIKPLGGRITAIHAVDAHGKTIEVADDHGRLTPLGKVRPGETIDVDVVIHRPGSIGWLLGSTQQEHLTIKAPKPTVTTRWITASAGGVVRLSFDQPVTRVVIGSGPTRRDRTLKRPERTITVGHHGATGTFKIAAAARSWEHAGTPASATYFPPAHETVAVGDPTPGGRIAPATPLRLTFSKTVDAALGSARPTLSPAVAGHWTTLNTHSIQFRPSGAGLALDSTLTITLPRMVAVVGPDGRELHRTQVLRYTVPPGSMLRLQQLLAQKGYLPVAWSPADSDVAKTPAAQARAAVEPPKGTFSWRYTHTPHELVDQWTPGQENVITKGALMTFESNNAMTADGVAGPAVWKALLADADSGAGESPVKGYSYVYVHRDVPQLLTLWHDGKTVLTSPGNTGVPAAPTQLGTFPVFEHLAVTTMSGTNPDGSKYHDPGIKWVSYFNGGDALHSFNRASFGTPQSLGCVELPLAAAAKIWPYTPIGTLVTIEN
jgi:hypothetical protein